MTEPTRPDFAYAVVASPLHAADAVARITAPVRAELDRLGGHQPADPTAAAGDPATPLVVVVATGGTERAIADLVSLRRAAAPWEPTVLVTHPLHNSLPAALEALAHLRATGGRGRIVQTPGDDEPATAIADLAALHRLRRARLGLVGEPSEWLVASVPDADRLRDRWGIELVDLDIGATIDLHRRLDPDAARPVAVRFSGGAAPSADTLTAARLHPALVAAIDAAGVDAVAVRCFDIITELSTSGCVALAELNDQGVVAGCEGDVASTVAMMLARALLDQPAWIANPARIDPAGGELVLAHCTVAPSMVSDLELHTHFESGLGVGLRGTFAPGWVTLLRLGGPALDRSWWAEAEVVSSGASPDLCRTQVTLRVDARHGELDTLLDAPLGNHLVMVHGRHRTRLERWWRLAFGT